MAIPFGKYALQRKLAEGGMAEVFLARQGGVEGFEKLVVVKRILPSLVKEQDFIKMFLNEARVAARLNHPNIVQIWDLGIIDELYFIAMEFVHGEDLRELFTVADKRKMRPPPGLVCRMVADTLAGLHYAHTRIAPDGQPLGLVHRDVSPQNVLVTYEGGVKLCDFGIAKATRATSEQTQAGLFKGKFAYMSPEQSRGQPVDARSDVFSVGILLWELLTWKRLFKRPNEMATLIAVAEEEIPSARSVEPTLVEELDRIVGKALARNLDDRYETAQEMRADLETLIREEQWEADALALQRYLRELFEDKLRAQAADIRAAGLASLEDFLLRVEEKTRLSWMEQRPHGVKTPSIGLSPVATPAPLYNDEPTEKERSRLALGLPTKPPASPAKPPHPVGELPSGPTLIAPNNDAPDDTPPPPAPPSPSQSESIVPRAHQISSDRYNAVSGSNDIVDDQLPPPEIPPPSPTVPPPKYYEPTHNVNDRSTAQRPYYNPPPSPLRRVLVIACAATVVAGIGLTVALWPQKDPPPPTPIEAPPATPTPTPTATPTPMPKAIPPASPAAPSPTPTTVTPTPPLPPGLPSTAAITATLIISTDAPAIITVDGMAAPLGLSATVQVKPGVPHQVTAQRPGHSLHKLRVPVLAQGERRPVSISVR